MPYSTELKITVTPPRRAQPHAPLTRTLLCKTTVGALARTTNLRQKCMVLLQAVPTPGWVGAGRMISTKSDRNGGDIGVTSWRDRGVIVVNATPSVILLYLLITQQAFHFKDVQIQTR